jgi:hypothetical protein
LDDRLREEMIHAVRLICGDDAVDQFLRKQQPLASLTSSTTNATLLESTTSPPSSEMIKKVHAQRNSGTRGSGSGSDRGRDSGNGLSTSPTIGGNDINIGSAGVYANLLLDALRSCMSPDNITVFMHVIDQYEVCCSFLFLALSRVSFLTHTSLVADRYLLLVWPIESNT